MGPFGAIAAALCLTAIVALAWPARQAWRRGKRYAGLTTLSLALATLALLAAVSAQLAGAAPVPTGAFLIGMSVGLAVGLTAAAGLLLLLAARGQAPA
ncbi:MAG TPA: hypothetical protein VF808_04275 [Ktedonobacterales bacterium]